MRLCLAILRGVGVQGVVCRVRGHGLGGAGSEMLRTSNLSDGPLSCSPCHDSLTQNVIFHSKERKTDEFIRIKIGSKTIKRENYVKYLSILVDSTLTWKPHITQLSKKLSRSVRIFFKIRHYVTPETLKVLYYSLFYSFISYGISVWGLTHPTILEPLCKIQKKVVRVITLSDKYSHSSPMLYNLELLKLRDSHFLNLFCFVYECMFHAPIVPFKEFFILS